MNIILGDTTYQQVKDKYIVLELDTFNIDGDDVTSYCVLDAGDIPLSEMSELPIWQENHAKLVSNWHKGNFNFCEQMIEQTVSSNGDLSAVLLRYFNPIGAHESGLIGEKPIGVPNNLVPFITQTAIGIRTELSVFGNDYKTRDGSCIRDFIHVGDVADAHVAALRYLEKRSNNETYKFNIGTGKGTSVLELIHAFEQVTGVNLSWKIADRRHGDVIEIYANTDLANQELKWKATRDIHQAMLDAWRWEKNLNA